MKIRKKPIIISLLSLVLCLSMVFGMTSCSPAKENFVEVTASIAGNSPMPRVSQTADNKYTFDHRDKIHIVGWYGNWENYNKPWEMADNTWWNDAVSTFDAKSGKWNTEPYMRWQNGKGLEHHFLSYWPANLVKPTENLTAVDVSVTGDYNKDDILLARWSGTRPEDNVLDLEFDHLMSRFDVHLYFRDEYKDATNISIETNLKKTAKCNFLTGDVTATEGTGIMMQERPYPDTNWDWSGTCITVPQDFAGPLLTIKFTTSDGEKSIDYTQPVTAILKFRSNERITLKLAVGKDKVELIDVSVNGWDQKNINAGEAEEQ